MMRIPVWVFLVLFTVSGFAGLIYESIWSHYLKLFLGHAAYAQTLVLGIFMGGMALGAWLVSRLSHRIRRALLGYAIAEIAIGFLALFFHPVFQVVTAWSFDSLIPSISSTSGVAAAKWLIAAILILPASVLLGTTFPLMSSGIMRAFGDHGGKSLPLLYFTNSFGAAVGVLASGFLMIERLGLPGTIFAAGSINIMLGLVVWLLSGYAKDVQPEQVRFPKVGSSAADASLKNTMLLVAFVTGAASFMFEIAWIRMLSMAIGASTHSFEVMLSAFILGIALGGLGLGLLGQRIGNFAKTLAWVLIAKCLCAMGAVWIYGDLLSVVKWLHGGIAKTESGYSLFIFASYVVSGLMMIPTAFFAGMTLPLATRAMLSQGKGESSIGRIYAANTLGAIAGTFFATHVGMELLGVQGITALGAGIELSIAILILFQIVGIGRLRLVMTAAPVLVVLFSFAFVFQLDKLKMASGVYRFGQFMSPSTNVEFHMDGKTATISVLRGNRTLDLRTNGKTDAGIRIDDRDRVSTSDEHTMTLLGIIPFMFAPDAESVANIGFGSGLTSHTVLGNPRVKRLDSIEIESAVIEGARKFLPLNERAYLDSRSNIHIDDAKTYFSAQRAKYDVIISEPSNPWISGVSTLFSDEFYGRIKHHINDKGVLVQWVQLYDTKPYIIASILKSLGNNFADYVIYFAGPGDAVIVASPHQKLNLKPADPFNIALWRESLTRLGYSQASEFSLHHVGSRNALEPLINSFSVRMNSDYFPVVDHNAPRERFMSSTAVADMAILSSSFVPLVALHDGIEMPSLDDMRKSEATRPFKENIAPSTSRAQLALRVTESLRSSQINEPDRLVPKVREKLSIVLAGRRSCSPELAPYWFEAYEGMVRIVSASLANSDNRLTLKILDGFECAKLVQSMPELSPRKLLIDSVVYRDFESVFKHSKGLIEGGAMQRGRLDDDDRETILQAYLMGCLKLGKLNEGIDFAKENKDDPLLTRSILTLALIAHLEHSKRM